MIHLTLACDRCNHNHLIYNTQNKSVLVENPAIKIPPDKQNTLIQKNKSSIIVSATLPEGWDAWNLTLCPDCLSSERKEQ